MKTTTKVLIVAGVGVAAFLFLRKKGPNAGITFTEFSVSKNANGTCTCFKREIMSDGTTRSTPTDSSNCADQFADPALGCATGGIPAFAPSTLPGKTSDGAPLTAFDLFGPTDFQRNIGENA